MRLRLITAFLFSLFLFSCSDSGKNEQPFAEAVIGSYAGKFTHRAAFEPITIEKNNHPLVVARNAEFPTFLECSIADFFWMVTFEGVTETAVGRISGNVKLYRDRYDIGIVGQEIAGSGSFAFSDGKLTIIWTADPINDRWSFSYTSE